MKKLLILLSLTALIYGKEANATEEQEHQELVTREIPPGIQIGFINLEGTITDSMEFVLTLKKYLATPTIKGLLLRINCGGGAPGASWHMYNELACFRKIKPVVALVEDMAASGAYWVACGASAILLSPVSEVGSVGVFFRQFTQKNRRLNSKDGLCADIEPFIMKVGKYKAANVEGVGFTEDQIDHQKNLLERLYKEFYLSVSRERKLDPEKAHEWAEGRVYIGQEAIECNFADKIGSITDAEQQLLALIPQYRMSLEHKNIVYMQADGKVLPHDKIKGHSEENPINTGFCA